MESKPLRVDKLSKGSKCYEISGNNRAFDVLLLGRYYIAWRPLISLCIR